MNIDPKFKLQPDWSPYKVFRDNPNMYIDSDGQAEIRIVSTHNIETGETTIKVYKNDKVMTDGLAIYDGEGLFDSHYNYYDYITEVEMIVESNGEVLFYDEKEPELLTNGRVVQKDQIWKANGLLGSLNPKKGDTADDPDLREGGIRFEANVGQNGETIQAISPDGAIVDISDMFDLRGGANLTGKVGQLVEIIKTSFTLGEKIGDAYNIINDLLDSNKKVVPVCNNCDKIIEGQDHNDLGEGFRDSTITK